jgi:hypothetical protein
MRTAAFQELAVVVRVKWIDEPDLCAVRTLAFLTA